MWSDPEIDDPHPIFDAIERRARGGEPTMLSFSPAAPAPGTARTVPALLAAAREEQGPRHALRR
ncbi:hypothetical protein WCD74_10410 [Actinomycetospora sp. OC33-EN08]|uniref:Uncharacterized protein n=1 Tax=Actinomycetospora aurantiaca TaxID=3129233 RepID=A0ABU8MLJ9_9PSEU